MQAQIGDENRQGKWEYYVTLIRNESYWKNGS